MFTLPSARRFLLPAAVILILLVILRVLADTGSLRSSHDALLQAALQRELSNSAKITLLYNASAHPHLSAGRKTTYRPPSHALPLPLAHPVIKQFTHCPIPANEHTSHIRLPEILYNISLTPTSASSELDKRAEDQNGGQLDSPPTAKTSTTRFFNPAIIPLPYWAHPARYILVSRVVTSGFHQESQICLADICLPQQQQPSSSSSSASTSQGQTHLPPDTRPCTPSDHFHLGSGGGLRCVSEPLKINIPPTPAEKCEDAWLAFPDIPGFHDPRVFWSDKGEPLILVNSASRYGCVGLWIVDLRVVYPVLETILSREDSALGVVRRDSGGEEGSEVAGNGVSLGFKPSMSYPHLTEITRNPRGSRASVEKNWVLWFPSGEEAYVQYDLLGDPLLSKDEAGLEAGQDLEGLPRLGLGGNQSQDYRYSNVTKITGHANNSTTKPRTKERRTWMEKERRGGRTFSKLIGNGFTTPNLTHPHEQPCFSAEEGDFEDSFGSIGHWHQGSNSLRLILCTRAQARTDPACRDDDYTDDDNTGGETTGAVAGGRSVHFAIIHRKFSNELDLPLRYERYVVVWEGREPFQILGVSRLPLLMRDEWAKPWTKDENWPVSGEAELKRKSNATMRMADRGGGSKLMRRGIHEREIGEDDGFDKSPAYFTYTPSLAWTWSPHSAAANQDHENDDVDYMSQLGTGYLGDDVLVGIGLDDVNQAFARVKVDSLLNCLRLCPGVRFAEEAS
ncbi:hypothetical protein G647_05323 [Cladophialophora carrionii CBS 160.54]|uniref:Uncharacterized protein n=1 Tax=Cladophialophora carrionii CBS 160.54 TaxID=1279043 RepID=V9DA13_9EURO|nr:uncharacterized protein G647_05323 [Cladophialophora carrionii CBS 160.54]ETI23521.1 hypothetical protein G647_05323 [Cladophialophora carrionii CBS 160.54]